MKSKKVFIYSNVVIMAMFICFIVSLFALVRMYRYKKGIDEAVERQKQISLYRQRLTKELEQVDFDYTSSTQKIIQYVKTHTKTETIDHNKIYTDEEMDQLRVNLYVDKYWDELEEWNTFRCEAELNMFIAGYGYVFQDQEEFVNLLSEREMLYQIKHKLENELDRTYQDGFSLE